MDNWQLAASTDTSSRPARTVSTLTPQDATKVDSEETSFGIQTTGRCCEPWPHSPIIPVVCEEYSSCTAPIDSTSSRSWLFNSILYELFKNSVKVHLPARVNIDFSWWWYNRHHTIALGFQVDIRNLRDAPQKRWIRNFGTHTGRRTHVCHHGIQAALVGKGYHSENRPHRVQPHARSAPLPSFFCEVCIASTK